MERQLDFKVTHLFLHTTMDINDKDEWTLIVASLGDHELRAERDRLQNSIQHLKRSNEELEEFVTEDEELQEVIDDNNRVIGSQEMRIGVLKAEITKRGISQEEGLEGAETGPKIEDVTEAEETAYEANAANDTASVAQTAQTEAAEPQVEEEETFIHL